MRLWTIWSWTMSLTPHFVIRSHSYLISCPWLYLFYAYNNMQYSKYLIPVANKIHKIKCICRAIEIQTAAVIKAQLKMCFHIMCKSSLQIHITLWNPNHYYYLHHSRKIGCIATFCLSRALSLLIILLFLTQTDKSWIIHNPLILTLFNFYYFVCSC